MLVCLHCCCTFYCGETRYGAGDSESTNHWLLIFPFVIMLLMCLITLHLSNALYVRSQKIR